MGIDNLIKLLKNKKIQAPQIVSLSDMGPGVAAVDASIFIHKFLCNRESKNFIISICLQIYHLLRFGIIPIFIFDGKPVSAKQSELEKRACRRQVVQQKLANLEKQLAATTGDKRHLYNQIAACRNQLVRIQREHVNLVKQLLRIFRLPWLDADADAEALACALNAAGKVDMVITDDSDCLIFGCKTQLKRYNNRKFTALEKFDISAIRKQLDFSQAQMVDLAILLGNDYSAAILPPGKAWSILHKYQNIEGILKNFDQIVAPTSIWYRWKDKLELLRSEEIDYQRVRNIFNAMYPEVTQEFVKPTKFRKFSPKRIRFLKLFLIKHAPGGKKAIGTHKKMFEFLSV